MNRKYSMAKILLLSAVSIVIGFSFYSVNAQETQQWSSCESDVDCVVVGAGCAIHAVNGKYQEEADLHYRRQNAQMDCEIKHAVSELEAKCQLNQCQLVEKKEQNSAHE